MYYLFGDYTLDTQRYELRRAGTVVKLRPKVFNVLAYLMAHRDRIVSKQELIEQLWPKQFVGEATLNSCIRAARQAVGDTGQAQRVIQTLHGRGFRFVAEIEGRRHELRESAMPPSPAIASPLEPQGGPVPSGPVLVPDDNERGEPERPTATGVDAEHKAVTVLCAGLVDATALAAQLGPEAMHHLMQACLATAQQVMQQYGGTLTHITGEGFVALFGAPRAEVQVDEGGTLGVAGRAVPVYQVRQITRRRSGVLGHGGRALSRFVGRERELAMLHERMRHATQGQGQVLGLAGEPGIGKSRLLYEFRQSLRERPVTYSEGHCLAYAGATPYLPVQDLLRQLCGIAETDGPEAITTKVHAHRRVELRRAQP